MQDKGERDKKIDRIEKNINARFFIFADQKTKNRKWLIVLRKTLKKFCVINFQHANKAK